MECLLPVTLLVDGKSTASDTTAVTAGPRVIVLRTAAADAELLLYSTYVGHDELEEWTVAELVELGDDPPALEVRLLGVGEGSMTYGRRFALYDHLQRLQALAADKLGTELRYEGVETAVRELDPAAV